MSTITFAPLKFAERLEKLGMPREHTKAEALADVLSSGTRELATKSNIQRLEIKLNGEMKLIKWMTLDSSADVAVGANLFAQLGACVRINSWSVLGSGLTFCTGVIEIDFKCKT